MGLRKGPHLRPRRNLKQLALIFHGSPLRSVMDRQGPMKIYVPSGGFWCCLPEIKILLYYFVIIYTKKYNILDFLGCREFVSRPENRPLRGLQGQFSLFNFALGQGRKGPMGTGPGPHVQQSKLRGYDYSEKTHKFRFCCRQPGQSRHTRHETFQAGAHV